MLASNNTTKKDRNWLLVIPLIFLIVITIFGIYAKYIRHAPIKSTTITTSDNVQQLATISTSTTISQSVIDTINTAVDQIIANYPNMQVSVTVANLNSKQSFSYGVDSAYYAASVGKLITATLYLHQVDTGAASLDTIIGGQTAQYQLQQMIEQSDNTAWKLLNENLSEDSLQTWADQNGLSNYSASQNSMTSADAATLLTQLYNGTLISKDGTDTLLNYMKNANKREYIVAAVADTMTVYHKAGWLDDRVLDTAIIDNGKQPIVLSIFTKTDDTYDTQAGQQLFYELTNTITTLLLGS